ncbi:energy transducer TonB [Acetobacteraceae bacterium ESL0697]|nr:energy transducer TonB [Acetobacteraceae bacterium ESL0697]
MQPGLPFDDEDIDPRSFDELEEPSERRLSIVGAVTSIMGHAGIIVALLWNHVAPLPEPPPPEPVEMVFDTEGSAAPPHKSSHKAQIPAPYSETESDEAPSPEQPKEGPHEPPPPTAPPPPPATSAPDPSKSVAKTELQQKSDLHEKGEISAETRKQPQPDKKQADLKAPPVPVVKPAKTPQESKTHQPNEAKKTQSDSHSLLATLDSFRTEQKQTRPPQAKANPSRGGSPKGGGDPDGDTKSLNMGEQKAIGASVRRCYQEDTAAKNYASFVARMIVTVDSTGEARIAEFAPDTAARMASDPTYRVLAERARAAVLSPTCAHLPVPGRLLGQTRQFRFVFRP